MTDKSVRQMGIRCSACGADTMTATQVIEGDRREFELSCPCGEGIREVSVRRPLTMHLCGPGPGSGPVTIGHVWEPE